MSVRTQRDDATVVGSRSAGVATAPRASRFTPSNAPLPPGTIPTDGDRAGARLARDHRLPLSGRDRAILRAVAHGSAELVVGVEPDLFLDGRWCADQFAAHCLARAGLIAPQGPSTVGRRVPARLTAAGRAHLAA